MILHFPNPFEGFELAQTSEFDPVDGDITQDLCAIGGAIDAEQEEGSTDDRADGDQCT